jgi:MFS transporter, DHA2 family, multidrug resistance protein
VDPQRQAIGWIGQLVKSQAQLLSYIDVFWALAVVAALMVPVALLLRPIPRGSTPSAH